VIAFQQGAVNGSETCLAFRKGPMRLCRVWDQNQVELAQIVHSLLLCMIKGIITSNLLIMA
jgi:hypothetical protein